MVTEVAPLGRFLPRDPFFLFVDDGLRFELGKRRDRIRETDRETDRETEVKFVCPAQARAPRWRCQAAWVVAPRGGVLGDPRWRQHALALGARAFHGADARRVGEI